MFYLLKRVDEKQFVLGDQVMVLADFSGIPAGTKGIVIEIYDSGVMVAWAHEHPDRTEKYITLHMILDKLRSGEAFMAAQGWRMDGFSRDELEYLGVATVKKPGHE